MRNVANHFILAAALAIASSLGACSSTGSSYGDSSDPLVGTWTYSGRVPNIVNVTLTFKSDKSFAFVETVAPVTLPPGVMPGTCVTTHTYDGAYVATSSSAVNTLDWTFSGGTANQVTGCSDPSTNSSGTPMTSDAIASYRNQGMIPPATTTYDVTATTLLLTSPDVQHIGIGRGPQGTTLTRSP